jgi:polyhydroxyalkanoate synthesis regulator phasin
MFEQVKKTIDKGVEFAFMTSDKIQQFVKETAKENNLTAEEAKKLFDQLVKKSEETKKNLEVKIIELQKAALDKMNLVTKDEFAKLEKRIQKLEGNGKKPARVKVPAAPAGGTAKGKTIRKK